MRNLEGSTVVYDDPEEVIMKVEDVFRHVYRVYPTVPSPFYTAHAA